MVLVCRLLVFNFDGVGCRTVEATFGEHFWASAVILVAVRVHWIVWIRFAGNFLKFRHSIGAEVEFFRWRNIAIVFGWLMRLQIISSSTCHCFETIIRYHSFLLETVLIGNGVIDLVHVIVSFSFRLIVFWSRLIWSKWCEGLAFVSSIILHFISVNI